MFTIWTDYLSKHNPEYMNTPPDNISNRRTYVRYLTIDLFAQSSLRTSSNEIRVRVQQ